MASGAGAVDGGKISGFARWFASWIKTTPAIIISLAAASTVLWGMFTYALTISPLGERVSAVENKQTDYEKQLGTINATVIDNAAKDTSRHNETMVELYTVQLLGTIDRSMGNANARQQILTLHQKIESAGGDNEYIEYELSRYLKSLE